MPGDAVPKVFDVEGALEAGCEKAAKGRDERCKGGHDEYVYLEGRVWDALEYQCCMCRIL